MTSKLQNLTRDLICRNSAIVAEFVGLNPEDFTTLEGVIFDILLKDGELKITTDRYGNPEVIRGDIMNRE